MKFLLFLFASFHLTVLQEDYNIIFVKGDVKVASSNETLTKGSTISSSDSISFSSPNDLVIVIGSSSGKYVIKPLDNERVSLQSELIYYVKNNLLPVKARTSSRDVSSDIIDFLELNKFIVIDRLSFELDEEIELFLESESGYVPFNYSNGIYSMDRNVLGKGQYLSLYEKIEGDHEFLAEVLVKRMDKKQLLGELSHIQSAFKENGIQEIEDHLRGYVNDTFGYLTPIELKSLLNELK